MLLGEGVGAVSIPETTIDRIKREVAIRGLVESHGVRLVGTSDNLKGLCPFHSESTPSLIVSPAKGLWHCFGACQTGGSVIDWVMKAQGVGFREAVAVLEEKLPPLAAPGAAVVEAASEVVVEAPAESPAIEVGLASDVVTLQRAVTFYHRTLREGGDGLAYLASRGLDSAEVVEAFQLGHANRSLGLRLPGKATKAGAAIRAQLQRLGILRPSGHELFNGSLVVPVFGEDGEVLEIYGRKLRPDVKFGSDHLYLPRRADGRRGRVQPAGGEVVERGDLVRGADRRLDVLERGLSERDLGVRGGGLHGGDAGGVDAGRGAEGVDRLRSGRGGG
jgi:DNA primase